jgi:kanamycin kinase
MVLPHAVTRLAAGAPVRSVWRNEEGATFEVGTGTERRFIKWRPSQPGIDLTPELQRLEWAAQYISVPRVLSVGADHTGMWFVCTPLPGHSAVSPRWTRQPGMAVQALGDGLRRLHEALPVDECPFSWSVAQRLQRVEDPTVRQELTQAPAIDRLVVCHGDACSPNTILRPDGTVSGFVDLGSLGVADRWADLAVATWATTWNYGAGWEEPLLTAYGIEPDPLRTAYYRALWDAAAEPTGPRMRPL